MVQIGAGRDGTLVCRHRLVRTDQAEACGHHVPRCTQNFSRRCSVDNGSTLIQDPDQRAGFRIAD